ncbi:MAG: hypothetical protein IJF92_00655 [Bacilli bacterium]|nr:hypothetical protein [Bacilli bacterium]MBQ3307676.1 hypothetical protein [Bacilli bacterium]
MRDYILMKLKNNILDYLDTLSVEDRFKVYCTIGKDFSKVLDKNELDDLAEFVKTETFHKLNITPYISNDNSVILTRADKKDIVIIDEGGIHYDDKTISYKSN